jgi:yjeF C-terminal region, hydroxyethylthiazole kinase-related/yjeF N-terminal region
MLSAVTAEIARNADNETIKNGTSSLLLMQRAAEAVFSFINKEGLLSKPTSIVCGRGNNGGDGYALANILIEAGVAPKVYAFNGSRTDDAEFFAKKYQMAGGEIQDVFTLELTPDALVIDAIFGTGLNKEVYGEYAEVIEKCNASGAYIIACDIASGLNSDNGRIMGAAVNANATVTFQSAKLGHFLNDGKDCTGKLIVADIGIVILEQGATVTDREEMRRFFKPYKNNVHKGDLGKSAIIGGSKNFIGAPWFAAMGTFALQVGSGLSYLAVPEVIYKAVTKMLVNNVVYTFPSSKGVIEYDETVLKKLTGCDAFAIGMGLGDCLDSNKILRFILKNSKAKVLIDADSLNLLDVSVLSEFPNRTLLTPHPKEFSRITGQSVSDIINDPVGTAKRFAAEHECAVLLKGATSVITDGERVALNVNGTWGMAKGGSGDLMDGIILGFLARGFSPYDAGIAGAYIAGRTAELALLREHNDFSVLAADRIGFIGLAVNEIIGK